MSSSEPNRYWTPQGIELLLLALTLLATVVVSSLTLCQTTRHFEIERTSSFVARFNSKEMVELREELDRWLESNESPSDLYDRSLVSLVGDNDEDPTNHGSSEEAVRIVSKLRTMANYFQEFGTALEVESLDENYAYELLGAVCIRYATLLEPFIMETRKRRSRPQAYEEILLLRDRMSSLDK